MYWDSCSTTGWFASGGKSYMVFTVELFHFTILFVSCQLLLLEVIFHRACIYISDVNDYIQCENFRTETPLSLTSHEKES